MNWMQRFAFGLGFAVLTTAQNYRVDPVAGVLTYREAENAREAYLNIPYGITADMEGNIYFHDRNHYRIRKLSVDGVLTTVAGNGSVGYSGDGGPAISARLNTDIGSMTFGPDRSLYFADGYNCAVRKISPDGIISTVAGSGVCGYSGDGGPALQARLNVLGSVSFDSRGNLFIGDGFNNRVRLVSPNGTISTFAGTGRAGFSGDGGPAAEAMLNLPLAYVDRGDNVWIPDGFNYRIRRVGRDGIIQSVVGNGTPGPVPDVGVGRNAPVGLVQYMSFLSDGSLLFTNLLNRKMYRLSSDDTFRRVVGSDAIGYNGDNGPALQAQTSSTMDLVGLHEGSVVFSDQLNHVLRKVDPAGVIRTIAGRERFNQHYGAAWETLLNGPGGVAWDPAGGYYVHESYGARLRRVDPDGTTYTIAGTGESGSTGDGGPARQAAIGASGSTVSIAVDSSRRVYIATVGNASIRRVTPGGVIETIAGVGSAGFAGDGGPATAARLNGPTGIVISSDGRIYFADSNNHRIRVIDTAGIIRTVVGTGERGFSGDGGPASEARLNSPTAVGLDSAGNLYILDALNNRIRRVDAAGNITTIAGNGAVGASTDGVATEVPLRAPSRMAVAADGRVWFTEQTPFPAWPDTKLRMLDPDGRVLTLSTGWGYEGDGGPLSAARFTNIAQMSVGPEGLLIADQFNNLVRLVTPE